MMPSADSIARQMDGLLSSRRLTMQGLCKLLKRRVKALPSTTWRRSPPRTSPRTDDTGRTLSAVILGADKSCADSGLLTWVAVVRGRAGQSLPAPTRS